MTNSEIQTAIVLKATDYKESDKLVRLFLPNGEVILASVKGVKKAAAKLKFAAQPLAFCEYSLSNKNGFYTVTNAVQIESLYNLCLDTDKFNAACVMLETVDKVSGNSVLNSEIFISLLKTFKDMLYGDTDPYAAAASFLYEVLKQCGYEIPNNEFNGRLGTPAPATSYIPELIKAAALIEKYFDTELKSISVI